jgi:hypothetical protein
LFAPAGKDARVTVRISNGGSAAYPPLSDKKAIPDEGKISLTGISGIPAALEPLYFGAELNRSGQDRGYDSGFDRLENTFSASHVVTFRGRR